MNNLQKFAEGLEKHFDIPAKEWKQFCCPTTFITQRFHLDAIKFDDLMHERHGEFEEERNMCTFDLIVAEYGENAKDWVESHI